MGFTQVRFPYLVDSEFPVDRNGESLAWPLQDGADGWYADAWNGIYASRDEALAEVEFWTADEADRILAHGERPVNRDA